uniref:Pentatricopeptide repeat-containing protein n=1 Tax=Nelumbo nucifera TaxID=4432 RepID=A0A822ZRZ1_NELNU|nr:TPA_asm: hypothetical protein HUJ06_004415 [Nelumbo nucifera]
MAYSHSGEYKKVLVLFNYMKVENVGPNQVTMAVAISVCGCIGALRREKEIHECFKNHSGMEMNTHIFNSLVDMYARCWTMMLIKCLARCLQGHSVL